jgi:hypothetical protein
VTTLHLPVRPLSEPAHAGPAAVLLGLDRALAAVAAMTGLGTWLIPGLLNGNAAMNGSARGTGMVLALVGAPVLVVAGRLTRRGSMRAQLVLLGLAGYVLYNAVLLCFATPFNELFLGYEALLGLAIATVIATATQIRTSRLDAYAVPARPVAAYLAVIVTANAVLWLSSVVSGLTDTDHPKPTDGTGLYTNPVHVQDLAFWLPVALLGAVWLWQRRPWGVAISAAVLAYMTVEGIGVAADQWMAATADPGSPVASKAIVPVFLALAVVAAGVLTILLRRVER